tara:strand:+ start:309 stop:1025 length:717 start_codon:yes stop_codon:yes gene_type:complete
MHSNNYTLIFTAILTIILGFFVSTADSSLREMREKNIEADIRKNILSSLGFEELEEEPWTNEKVEEMFSQSIVGFVIDSSGKVIEGRKPKDIDSDSEFENFPIYKRVENDIIQGYSIPISGKGLWGTMYGYFSIEPDGATAKGITFYAHIETPGLGAEVDKPWFQNNFPGKKFIDNEGNLIGIQAIKGGVDDSSPEAYHQVDGISGATMTTKGLNIFLLKDLKIYDPYLSKIRALRNS